MTTRKHSKDQETRVAKALGGKVVANSGATAFNKGDVVTELFAIECKTLMKEQLSHTIKKEWIDGIREEAFGMGKPYSAIAFNFGGLGNTRNFYIIDERLFKLLNEYLEEEM